MAIAVGHEDGTLGFISQLGCDKLFDFKEPTEHGPIMDIAWRTRTSMMEPFNLVACRPDGTISKWSSVNPNKTENILLNERNQFMTVDCSSVSRQFAIAGSLPQVEIYDFELMKAIQIAGD